MLVPATTPDMFPGLLGDLIEATTQVTEAHPVALAAPVLVGIGSAIGRDAYTYVGETRHGLNENVSLRSGGGRVDAPGEWLVGAKGEYPLRRPCLPAGGSDAPHVLLRRMDLDIDDPAFWQRGFAVIRDLLGELRDTL